MKECGIVRYNMREGGERGNEDEARKQNARNTQRNKTRDK
jgi:hypothetical protein